jgi:hypothetical protein
MGRVREGIDEDEGGGDEVMSVLMGRGFRSATGYNDGIDEHVHVYYNTLITIYFCTYLQLCINGFDCAEPPIPTATAPVMRSVVSGQCGPLKTPLHVPRFPRL